MSTFSKNAEACTLCIDPETHAMNTQHSATSQTRERDHTAFETKWHMQYPQQGEDYLDDGGRRCWPMTIMMTVMMMMTMRMSMMRMSMVTKMSICGHDIDGIAYVDPSDAGLANCSEAAGMQIRTLAG